MYNKIYYVLFIKFNRSSKIKDYDALNKLDLPSSVENLTVYTDYCEASINYSHEYLNFDYKGRC